MASAILWYLAITFAGVVVFPLGYQLFSRLSDRGYGFSKPLGLLLWAFLFWLFNNYQIAQNDRGGIFVGLFILVGVSFWVIVRSDWRSILEWVRQHRVQLIVTEIVFVLAYIAWVLVRAAGPEIVGTEKPMELAFINAILKSPSLPAHDPWLSGFSISYYHFGYVMVAMLAKLCGTDGAVAFNLGGALWFALVAQAAYSLLYNLLVGWQSDRKHANKPGWTARIGALLGPVYILILSNLEGFLEMLHARGVFWYKTADGSLTSSFWSWLGILELNQPPTEPFSWIPERLGGTWWWRASRVLLDTDVLGGTREIIDEFPFFSYYLADLHPHVLSMPFVLIFIGYAYQLFLSGSLSEFRFQNFKSWVIRQDFWVSAFLIGSLAFLNTWDALFYAGLFAFVFLILRMRSRRLSWSLLGETILLCLCIGIAAFLLFLPFFLGFASQAGGLLPSLGFFTRGVQFWVMFGVLIIPILAWLIYRWRTEKGTFSISGGLKFSGILVGGLWIISYLWGILLVNLQVWGMLLSSSSRLDYFTARLGSILTNLGILFMGVHGNPTSSMLFTASIVHRLASPGTWITLLIMIGLTWVLLKQVTASPNPDSLHEIPVLETSAPQTDYFVYLLVFLGACLALFPEFFYLRDQFGWRMNTIFKFYFQIWIIWGIAAAFAVVVLISSLRSFSRWFYLSLWMITAVMGLVYPLFALNGRLPTSLSGFTLDGLDFYARSNPGEYEAIQWLRQAPLGIVAEAVGGSYSGFARVSMISGQPAVLGWPGHESQWRGGNIEIGSREPDIERLYRATDWREIQEILRKYQVRYVYVGSLEIAKYRANASRFRNHLKPVFENNDAIIFYVPEEE
ncbi:MAG TPA: DUF2298 domain-containing protein [Anaerolineaceae bacterium]